MRLIIGLFFILSLYQLAEAKTLQGDGVNGIIREENFMKQGDAEIVISDVRTYNNGDVAEPTTCSGGTATGLRYDREKSDDMGGNFYWKITKSAGTQRGKGVAFDFTIDKFTSREQIEQELYTRVSTLAGTFVTGDASDVKLFIYDRDAATKVNVRGGNSILGPEVLRWYNPKSGSRNFTACFHVATTSTSAYTLGIKNLMTGVAKPESRGDVNNTFTADIMGTQTPITVLNQTGPYDLISSCTRPSNGRFECTALGLKNIPNCTTTRLSTSLTSYGIDYLKSSSTNTKLVFNSMGGSDTGVNRDFTISCTRTGSDYVPNAVLADQYTGMDIKFYGTKSASQAMTSGSTKLTLTSIDDSVGSWEGDQYRVKTPGIYIGSSVINFSANGGIYVYKNGVRADLFVSNTSASNGTATGAVVLFLDKDDIIDFRSSANFTVNNGSVSFVKSSSSRTLLRPTNAVRYIVKTFKSGTTQWDLYNDGFCDQEGRLAAGSDGLVTVTFPLQMRDTNYTIGGSVEGNSDGNIVIRGASILAQNKAVASMGVYRYTTVSKFWRVRGDCDSAIAKSHGATPSY